MHQNLETWKSLQWKGLRPNEGQLKSETIEDHIRWESKHNASLCSCPPQGRGVPIWSLGELGPRFDQQSHMIKIRHFTSLGLSFIICKKKRKKLHLSSTFIVYYLLSYTKNSAMYHFYIYTALPRYNSPTIRYTYLKCTSQWFLAYSHTIVQSPS